VRGARGARAAGGKRASVSGRPKKSRHFLLSGCGGAGAASAGAKRCRFENAARAPALRACSRRVTSSPSGAPATVAKDRMLGKELSSERALAAAAGCLLAGASSAALSPPSSPSASVSAAAVGEDAAEPLMRAAAGGGESGSAPLSERSRSERDGVARGELMPLPLPLPLLLSSGVGSTSAGGAGAGAGSGVGAGVPPEEEPVLLSTGACIARTAAQAATLRLLRPRAQRAQREEERRAAQ
jgi:hypothetical protein